MRDSTMEMGCGMCRAPSKDYHEIHAPSHLCSITKVTEQFRVRTNIIIHTSMIQCFVHKIMYLHQRTHSNSVVSTTLDVACATSRSTTFSSFKMQLKSSHCLSLEITSSGTNKEDQ